MNKLIIIALALSLAACGHSKKKTSDHKSNIDLTAAGRDREEIFLCISV